MFLLTVLTIWSGARLVHHWPSESVPLSQQAERPPASHRAALRMLPVVLPQARPEQNAGTARAMRDDALGQPPA
ncbi:hypothetical protein, partial [Blastomonas sp. UPD001]|uniref:hypothetical protein n=1 Tax=Blastomonas sp. UPD001 TaxID=2217673 RepID=UPI001E349152